jgi:hypothetical protein
VSQYDQEPTIATQVTLETLSGDEWHAHPAVIADLTRQELWVAIDSKLGEPLAPGRPVRLVLRHPNRPTQTADTIVLWHIGRNGAVSYCDGRACGIRHPGESTCASGSRSRSTSGPTKAMSPSRP